MKLKRIPANSFCLHEEVGSGSVIFKKKKISFRVIRPMNSADLVVEINDEVKREGGFSGMKFVLRLSELVQGAFDEYEKELTKK